MIICFNCYKKKKPDNRCCRAPSHISEGIPLPEGTTHSVISILQETKVDPLYEIRNREIPKINREIPIVIRLHAIPVNIASEISARKRSNQR